MLLEAKTWDLLRPTTRGLRVDRPQLEPIERHLRQERPPTGATAVLRGGPLTVDKLVEHALRQEREFSYASRPMSSISVYLTVAGWTLESLLRDRLWSRSTFATCVCSDLVAANYVLLPTHDTPHYDIILPASTEAAAGMLLAVFGEALPNPFKHRRR